MKRVQNFKCFVIISMIAFFIITFVSACSFSDVGTQKPFIKDAFLMNTIVRVTIYGDNAEEAADKIFNRIREIEDLMSIYKDGSYIYEVNRLAGIESVRVDEETFFVVKKGLEYSEQSQGKFDITIQPLVKLWDIIGEKEKAIPETNEIQKAISYVDYTKVVLDEDKSEVFLIEKNMGIDLGGIAKGYAADQAIKVLKEAGIESASVSIGGNIKTLGRKPDNSFWKIGIQNPFYETRGKIMASVEIHEKTVVTSGIYERFVEIEGVKYHHIFDPFTGYPVENSIVSVTIVCDESIDADALSTVVFVMGIEDGMTYVDELRGIEAMFIMDNDDVLLSEGLKGKVKILDERFVLQ